MRTITTTSHMITKEELRESQEEWDGPTLMPVVRFVGGIKNEEPLSLNGSEVMLKLPW